MSKQDKSSDKVGVRELRQNLSVYLRRVQEGEALQVTARGEPVALLIPLPSPASPLQTLIATGQATAPQGDVLELGLPPGEPSRGLSEALEATRQERL